VFVVGRRSGHCPGAKGNPGNLHKGPNAQLPPTGLSGNSKKSSSTGGNKKSSNKKASKGSSTNGDNNNNNNNNNTAAGNIARTILSNLNIFGEYQVN
jgi:hypothetical protein